MTKREIAHFNMAKAASETSDHRIKMGCAVISGHKCVSTGCNSLTRCHRVQAILDKERFGVDTTGMKHAEVDALLPLIQNGVDLSGASVFVYREHKNGALACAKPCPSCEKLIKQCGVKRIYYTIENGYAQENTKM